MSKEEFVVVINFSNRTVFGHVDVLHANEFEPVTPGVKRNARWLSIIRLEGFLNTGFSHRQVRR